MMENSVSSPLVQIVEDETAAMVLDLLEEDALLSADMLEVLVFIENPTFRDVFALFKEQKERQRPLGRDELLRLLWARRGKGRLSL